MVVSLIGQGSHAGPTLSRSQPAAWSLGPAQRVGLSLQALARVESVSGLARQNGVSRKFVRQQAAKAGEALEGAFDPVPEDRRVLFYLPVTKDWLRQFVLAQVLIGHTSYRGVAEIAETVLDYRGLSLGHVHQILLDAVAQAQVRNAAEDLGGIAVGAHDEIYQAGHAVLVGIDVRSTYCYLLAAAEHVDETTWGVHLLDLGDRGLHPQRTIADGGAALRAGQAAAWGEAVPCNGDVFHVERELGRLVCYLRNRATGCQKVRQKLEERMDRLQNQRRGQTLSAKLGAARQAEKQARGLAEDVQTLSVWMQQDILGLAGPDLATRRELFDFVLEQLRGREGLCPHRVGPVCRVLEHQRENLLAFAGVLDQRLEALARQEQVSPTVVRAVSQWLGMDPNQASSWQCHARLCRQLGTQFGLIEQAVRDILADTPRASSVVENLNSRLRNYFFLRRQLGAPYLDLLRFFLNHRRFRRSHHRHRVGQSPAQLLSGQAHGHWLELLGYQRFHRN